MDTTEGGVVSSDRTSLTLVLDLAQNASVAESTSVVVKGWGARSAGSKVLERVE